MELTGRSGPRWRVLAAAVAARLGAEGDPLADWHRHPPGRIEAPPPPPHPGAAAAAAWCAQGRRTVADWKRLGPLLGAALPVAAWPAPGTAVGTPGPPLSAAAQAALDSAPVILAVVDMAVPLHHPWLTLPNGASRVAAAWAMDAPADPGSGVPFGRALTGPQIEALAVDGAAALRGAGWADPAHAAGRPWLRAGSHGAAVAALAAARRPDDPAATRHPVIAVSLPAAALADTSGMLMPVALESAGRFVIDRARAIGAALGAHRPPVVVTVALGVTAGATDGTSWTARVLGALAACGDPAPGPVRVVLPSGNARQWRAHAALSAMVPAVGWRLAPADPTPSLVELWGPAGADDPALAVALPGGPPLRVPPLRGAGVAILETATGGELARVYAQRRRDGDGAARTCLTLIVPPTLPDRPGGAAAPAGVWTLAIDPAGGATTARVVVQRDDALPGLRGGGRPSRLIDPAVPARRPDGRWPGADPAAPPGAIRRSGTLNSFGGAPGSLRVGARVARGGGVAPYAGLENDGAPGDAAPVVEAGPGRPGMTVPGLAPGARGQGRGTSLAAGLTARWLAAAIADGRLPAVADDAAIRVLAAAEPAVPSGLPWRSGIGGPA